MKHRSKVRRIVNRQRKENRRAMAGLGRLASMSEEEARAYVEGERIRAARLERRPVKRVRVRRA